MLCDEVAHRKAIFQTGSQQHSMADFRRAPSRSFAMATSGASSVEVGLPDGYEKPMGDATITAPAENSNYELWTGPAPFCRSCTRHHRWWRGNRAYGGGTLMDWIGHHNDIAEWGLGPDRAKLARVEAVDWKFPETDIYDTPVHFDIHCQYVGGVETSISDRTSKGRNGSASAAGCSSRDRYISASDPRWAAADFSRANFTSSRQRGIIEISSTA